MPAVRGFRTVNRNAILWLKPNGCNHLIGVNFCTEERSYIILVPRADINGIAKWQIQKWPQSLKQSCRLKPATKRAIKISVEIGECVQKLMPYGPGGSIRAFLMDCLDTRFALMPQMLFMADVRGKPIASSIAHVQDGKDPKESSTIIDSLDFGRRERRTVMWPWHPLYGNHVGIGGAEC
jgi:hypothetical protein